MNKYDIFISYSRKDFDEVNAIVEMLKSRIPTLNCWFDITGIESGDEFEDKIITAIDNSSYVLFALSDNAIESKYAKKEVMYAQAIETKVIPLLLKDSQLKGWFLFNFGRIDCIDTTNSLQIEKLIKNLSDWTGKASITKSDKKTTNKKDYLDALDEDDYFDELLENIIEYGFESNSSQKTEQEKVQISSSTIQTIYYTNGKIKYEGEIKNGKRHGQGTYYFVSGAKYIGEFKDNKRHGQGTYYYANGDKYVGEFENGIHHGQGILYYANGDKYEGEFKKHHRDGQGTLYYANGDKYIGEFENDHLDGQGTIYYANGNKYIGGFENNYLDGQGILYYANGNKYEGEFKYNLYHGQGTLYYANGDKYEGKFKNGKLKEGQSTLYFSDGTKITKTYENGKEVWTDSQWD